MQDPAATPFPLPGSAESRGASQPRVVLVTGSASGIGAACGRAFAASGWHVGLSWLDEANCAELAPVQVACTQAQAGSAAHTEAWPLDVRDDVSCTAYVQAALARWGRIDALINCAGTTRFIPHADLDALAPEEFHRTYDVNTVGLYRVTRACAAALRASGQGCVVNISSIGGQLGRGSSMAYAASKGAVNTLTLALARALAPEVRVNAIAPGMVDGGLPARVLDSDAYAEVLARQVAQAPLRRYSQPDEVAALARLIVESLPGMTGTVIPLDNGLHLNAG